MIDGVIFSHPLQVFHELEHTRVVDDQLVEILSRENTMQSVLLKTDCREFQKTANDTVYSHQ